MSDMSSALDTARARSGRALIAAAGALFLTLALAVHLGARPPGDAAVLTEMHEWSRPTLDSAMLLVTRAGGAAVIVAMALAGGAWLAFRRRWLDAVFLVGAVGGASVVTAVLKRLVERNRPDVFQWLTPESGYSFPSGHATASMALALAVVTLTWNRRGRWAIAVVAIGAAVLVGASRIYLGVHYPSDVAAGWIVAAGSIAGSVVVRRGTPRTTGAAASRS